MPFTEKHLCIRIKGTKIQRKQRPGYTDLPIAAVLASHPLVRQSLLFTAQHTIADNWKETGLYKEYENHTACASPSIMSFPACSFFFLMKIQYVCEIQTSLPVSSKYPRVLWEASLKKECNQSNVSRAGNLRRIPWPNNDLLKSRCKVSTARQLAFSFPSLATAWWSNLLSVGKPNAGTVQGLGAVSTGSWVTVFIQKSRQLRSLVVGSI